MPSKPKIQLLLSLLLFCSACECGKQPPKVVLLPEGANCSSDDTCATGLCDGPHGLQAHCVRKCAVGCNLDEVCTQLTIGRFACQPDTRQLCQACELDADCPYPSDHCIVVNGEHVCGRDCAFDQSCPTGYNCLNAQGTDGKPKLQQCTPINASCACLARGDFMQPCEVKNTFGTCTGIKQCDLVNNTVACDAKTPVAETCNGLDDNCDGKIDEGQPMVSCGVGACQRSVTTCTDGGVASCLPGDAGVESCNGLDDDCDGVVDNGFSTTSDVLNCGACGNACNLPHATPACLSSKCVVQSCATGYGNCNAIDPDGCEASLDTDPMHCGNCSTVCSQQNATASCIGGNCQFVCKPGFIDLNQDPSDGCEYQCTPTSTTDLPDLLFVDANCDGIDGELNNGVFVSVNGNDANPGTKALPKKTLAAAASTVVTASKRDIYLSTGSYTGPLELLGVSTVNVAGGYDPTTWKRAQNNTVNITGGNPALKIEGSSGVLIQTLHIFGADGTAAGVAAYGGWVKESQNVKLESLDLTAGNGFAGAAGSTGTAGTPGDPGGSGSSGCVDDVDLVCSVALGNCSRPGAGAGGNGCGYPGGAGGQPSHIAAPTPPGDPGNPAPNGSGAGGSGAPAGITPAGPPYYGVAGTSGTTGPNGAGASTTGAFGLNGFVPSAGLNGTAGTPGKGGGGAGAGAGGTSRIFPFISKSCQAWGSAGGGGGGGGCGGAGGLGGGGGGASIGLFLYNANVTAQAVAIHASNGGGGGAGGTGGVLGSGGSGGVSPYDSDQGTATRGGNGGAGGNGGPGGHGGGGAGGSSYGLVRNAASTWNPISGTSITLGVAGAAGPSSGQGGVAGTTAIQLTF